MEGLAVEGLEELKGRKGRACKRQGMMGMEGLKGGALVSQLPPSRAGGKRERSELERRGGLPRNTSGYGCVCACAGEVVDGGEERVWD